MTTRPVVALFASTLMTAMSFPSIAADDPAPPSWMVGSYRVSIYGLTTEHQDRSGIVESTGVLVVSNEPIRPGLPKHAAGFPDRYKKPDELDNRVCAYFVAVGSTLADMFQFVTTSVTQGYSGPVILLYESPDYAMGMTRIQQTPTGFEAKLSTSDRSDAPGWALVAVRDDSISLDQCISQGLEVSTSAATGGS